MYQTISDFHHSYFCRHRVVWIALFILITACVSVMSAAQEPTPTLAPNEFIASKIEDIVGIWETRFMGAVAYEQYKADGTWKLAGSIENLEKYPTAHGTFWFEATAYNRKGSLSSAIGTYEIRVQKKDDKSIHLAFTVIDDPNTLRAKDLTAGMTWVEPSLQAQMKEKVPPQKLDLQYLMYLPKEYEEGQKTWPLLLFLHGIGERGDDLELLKKNGPPYLAEKGEEFPFITVAPQCPENLMWNSSVVIESLDRLLHQQIEQYRVDEERIYVTGLSMGGTGTWALALAYPDRFAAIVPICGWSNPDKAELIKNLPVWVFHGAKDETVPLERSQEMVDALESVGANVKFTIYPDAGHDVWTETYNNPELYEWLLQHRREKGME